MKVKTIKAIEIEGIGLFRCASEWEIFTKWVSVENPREYFISVDIDKSNFFMNILSDENNELSIVMGTSSILEKLKDKKEPKPPPKEE